MYIDMGEMIADEQDRPSLIIEDPQGPKNSPKYKYLYILPHIWKTWFSNCFLLLYICFHCDEVCICWHVGAPGTHEFYVRPQPRKKIFIFCYIFYFNSKCSYQIAFYIWHAVIIKERVDVNQDGPSHSIEASPGPK